MASKAGIITIPLIIAALAAAAGFAAISLLSFSTLQAGFVGVAVFCILIAGTIYVWMALHVRRIGQKMDGYISFEDNMVKRLHDIERWAGKADEQLASRINRLEEKLKAQGSPAIETGPRQPTPEFDSALASAEDNVVALNPLLNSALEKTTTSKVVSKQRSITAKIDHALNNAEMTIRLQPILNLIDKEVIGVEAFAFFKSGQTFTDGREFIGRMTEIQRSLYDLKVVHALSSVVREMHHDGQTLPVHYRFVSMTTSADANWLEISQALSSDPKLVANLVPVVPQKDYLSMQNKALEKILGLRECGLKLCLAQITDYENALEPSTLRHFQKFKIHTDVLLTYRSNESERFADQLLPGLLKENATIFVDGITSAYQASQLIDLDLMAGQGDYICEPKGIRLYKDAEETIAPAIADDAMDSGL